MPAERVATFTCVPRLILRPPSPRFDLAADCDYNFFGVHEIFSRLRPYAQRASWIRAAKFWHEGRSIRVQARTDASIATAEAMWRLGWDVYAELF